MERKDYAEKFRTVKNDIIKEIRTILGSNEKHDFSEPFFIHYVDGEVATTEECVGIEINNNGMFIVVYRLQGDTETFATESDAVFRYSCESFLDFLDHLKKEMREKKLQTLREIVDNNACHICFDGKFRFTGTAHFEDGSTFEHEECYLTRISIENDILNFYNTEENHTHKNTEEFISDDELDRMIEYIKCVVKPKFTVRAAETRSRTFEFYTGTYEEAIELAKKELEKHPLDNEDSDGLYFS